QVSTVLSDPNLSGLFLESFLSGKEPLELHEELSREFFWRAGDYGIDLTVYCAKPNSSLVRRWHFTVTKSDEDALRLNIVVMIRALCFLPATYVFAYKEYIQDLRKVET